MADQLPINFAIPTEQVIASYDFYDLAAQVGYKRFYGMINNEGNILITNTIESNDWRTVWIDASGTKELNFDVTFNSPLKVGGDAYVSFTISANATGTTLARLTPAIRILHVDTGASETELAASITGDAVSATDTNVSVRDCITMAIPDTHFKIGEKLRIEFIGTIYTEGFSSTETSLYHDPAGRVGAAEPFDVLVVGQPSTTLEILLPIDIQL